MNTFPPNDDIAAPLFFCKVFFAIVFRFTGIIFIIPFCGARLIYAYYFVHYT